MTMYVRQTEIPPLITIGQLRMVYSEQMKNCCIEIMNVHGSGSPFILIRLDHVAILVCQVVPILIRLTISNPGLDSSSGHPSRKGSGVMIAAIIFLGKLALTISGPTKLASPNDQSVLQHTPLLEILDEGGAPLIHVFALIAVFIGQATMSIPSTVENLDIANPPLGQSSSIQATGGERTGLPRLLGCRAYWSG